MAFLEEFLGAKPKRQIEEKTDDYQKRVSDDYAKRAAAAKKRSDEVKALADFADTARRKKFMANDRAAHRAWQFSCKVSGGFIVLRWKDDKQTHAHALNMASVSDIKLKAGKPVRRGDVVRFNEHHWEFVREGERWSDYSINPYWTGYFEVERWSSAATFASIEFVGPGFVIDRIPHRKADEAYLAVMSAIEGGK